MCVYQCNCQYGFVSCVSVFVVCLSVCIAGFLSVSVYVQTLIPCLQLHWIQNIQSCQKLSSKESEKLYVSRIYLFSNAQVDKIRHFDVIFSVNFIDLKSRTLVL